MQKRCGCGHGAEESEQVGMNQTGHRRGGGTSEIGEGRSTGQTQDNLPDWGTRVPSRERGKGAGEDVWLGHYRSVMSSGGIVPFNLVPSQWEGSVSRVLRLFTSHGGRETNS